eukprot:2349376-Rhodomonas_salina.1
MPGSDTLSCYAILHSGIPCPDRVVTCPILLRRVRYGPSLSCYAISCALRYAMCGTEIFCDVRYCPS